MMDPFTCQPCHPGPPPLEQLQEQEEVAERLHALLLPWSQPSSMTARLLRQPPGSRGKWRGGRGKEGGGRTGFHHGSFVNELVAHELVLCQSPQGNQHPPDHLVVRWGGE
eukprot:757689-Hanusia_phi.AAC.1